MKRLGAIVLCAALAACGGSSKKDQTTPKAAGSGSGNTQSMQDTGTPDMGSGAVTDSACTMMPATRHPPASLIA